MYFAVLGVDIVGASTGGAQRLLHSTVAIKVTDRVLEEPKKGRLTNPVAEVIRCCVKRAARGGKQQQMPRQPGR